MGWTKWVVIVLLVPFMLVAVGMQLALATGLFGAAQLAWASQTRSSATLTRGLYLAHASTELIERSLNSPAVRLYELNPLALGVVDDVRAWGRVVGAAGDALVPGGSLAAAISEWDGNAPIVVGASVATARVPALAEPTARLEEALSATREALDAVPTSGWLGSRTSASVASVTDVIDELSPLMSAASIALPGMADALGASGPKFYLLAALNDAELFGSGGAPLYAALIKADEGTLSIELSGQLESKLSPGNPPIPWDPVGGLPWYREGRNYPFVNSNFHPDFSIAAQDMSRAWAGLGYPEVDGVVTVDVNALAAILGRTGPVDSEAYGLVTAENVVTKVLVDSYREFGSDAVEERHARNDELAAALVSHLAGREALVQAMRGVLESIPPRHIQAGFATQALNAAVEELAATGTLADEGGDLIGAFTQNAPNKLSVFQARTIRQEVQLTGDGGAVVRRRVAYANDVPIGTPGRADTARGYEALRARFRVAHRIPLTSEAPRIRTKGPAALLPAGQTGPFPDDRGGQVLWQGHEIAPRDSVTDVITYRLPPGTFSGTSYEMWADPQAITIPVELELTVQPPPGGTLQSTPGWAVADGALVWSGILDRPLHLEVP